VTTGGVFFMSKITEQKAPMGKRITGKDASATASMPFYEFLLFDPLYREMKDKAKILYCFLRKKSETWEYLTKQYEAGEEGFTKSYRDDNSEIYVIADNSELSIVLQCHPNRVKDQKDELKRYGLLEEVEQFQSASHLYVLKPKVDDLTEKWAYIEEMKQLREETQKINKQKAEKHKAKKHNSQIVSYDNSQNVGYNNSQIVSKNLSKGFKDISKSLKDSFNLSIQETSLPIPIQKTLVDRIDRLIEYKIKVIDIDNHFQAVKEAYTEVEYNFVIAALLDEMSRKPRSFANVMNNWLKRNREKLNEAPSKDSKQKAPVRKEVEPDWLDSYEAENRRREEDKANIKDDLSFEDRKAAIEAKLAAFRA
jgi:hypothetical protein